MQALQVGTTYQFPIAQLPGIVLASQNPSPPVQGMGSQYGGSYSGGMGNPQSGGYGNYPRSQSSYARVENHLVKAIFSTLCCCLPVGVVAIVYAAQVEGHSRRGDYGMAQSAAATADTWANWAIGLGLVGALLQIVASGIG